MHSFTESARKESVCGRRCSTGVIVRADLGMESQMRPASEPVALRIHRHGLSKQGTENSTLVAVVVDD
jgi:hypothetical protein